MAEQNEASQRWLYGLGYTVVITLLILIHLVPLSIAPGRFPGPDLLVALTFAWVLRRPDYVPALLIAVLFLMADLLFMRPIGLWAALIVIATEFFRARESSMREQTFLMEWAMVAGVLLAATVAYRFVLTILFVQQVSLGLALFQFLMTVLLYPTVVLASHWIFRVTKMTSSQANARGRPR